LLDYDSSLSFYWVHFRLNRAKGRGAVSLPQHGRPPNPERITELFHRFLDDQESGALTPPKAALLVMLMLLEIPGAPSHTPAESSALAGRARDYIATHFRGGLHAGDVARAIGCNPDYLGRIYRRVFGHTLSHAIHLEQIRAARILLREGSLNMEQIAAACGFQESRYFRKLFATRHGISPRDYRKLYARLYINTD
jgi:AraC-like DNA-binding protein